MTQTAGQKPGNNIILIAAIALILLLGGLGYYYFVKPKLPLIYTTNIGMDQTVMLKPRPIRRRPYPKIEFYLSGEVIDVSKYQQIELIDKTNTGLRILEELEEKGLMLIIEPLPRKADEKVNITLEEPDVLKKMPAKQGTSQVYTIEVDKLKKGKKYIICEDIPWENHPLRYFIAFTRHPPQQDQ